MGWIIRNANDPDLCWNGDDGWTDSNYETFTDEERQTTRLPMEGEWEQVSWNANCDHNWIEVNTEPPYDMCNGCGDRRD